jgi:hypothetical protein
MKKEKKSHPIMCLILFIWTVWGILNISQNCSRYSIFDWFIAIFLIVLPYSVILTINRVNKSNRKDIKNTTNEVQNYNNSSLEETSTEIVIESTTNNDIPSSMPSEESTIQYIETEDDIFHADSSPISDEEVPYLIQLGYEKSLQKEGLYQGQILDLSFMKERDKNKKEYTSLPTYNELLEVEPVKSSIFSTDIFFLKYIDGLTLENPFIAQYWFYDYNLNYSKEIKKLIANKLLIIQNVNIEKLKIPELKNILRNFSLPLSGRKQELQDRIYKNISYDELSAFLGDSTHYFTATEAGKALILQINESSTKNLELENTCIDLIMDYKFYEAFSLILEFKRTLPGEADFNIPYTSNMDERYEDIMDSVSFFYTLSKNRDLEPKIRASIIFCRMYGVGQDNILKMIKRMYLDNNIDFDEDSQNLLKGRLL